MAERNAGAHAMRKRFRHVGSIKNELLRKSREAALAAVQIFNNPNITFKSESYVVLMIIAWTYLLHAYFRHQKIDYRYYKQKGTRRSSIKQSLEHINIGNLSDA